MFHLAPLEPLCFCCCACLAALLAAAAPAATGGAPGGAACMQGEEDQEIVDVSFKNKISLLFKLPEPPA